ncbi:MAG TPA: SDR family oxidoreductase [Clostridia bacterium]|nr:SDR family oxidoreductase [Clostridia bacterium]
MNSRYGNVVLVTGASSGIGRSVAVYLAGKGLRVYGTSRKPQSEEEAGVEQNESSGGFIKMLRMDVCSEDSVRAAIDKVIELEGEIGVVVNNAGIGIAGSVEDTSPEEAFVQFDTNFFGMHRVVRQVLPHMRKKGRGLIINMSSVGALFPIPYQSMYVASKAAIEGMSGSLRNELKPFGIKVSMVEPGDTKTGFTASRIFVKEGGEGSAYKNYSDRSVAVMVHDETHGPDPVVVARVVGKIIKKRNPPVVKTVGFQYKLLVFAKRIIPKVLESFIVGKMYEGRE